MNNNKNDFKKDEEYQPEDYLPYEQRLKKILWALKDLQRYCKNIIFLLLALIVIKLFVTG